MTIAVAVRTNSAVVFATDSKVTARGLSGRNEDGSPNWVDQTYDNATKVAHDSSKQLMALAAGHGGIGRAGVAEFVSMQRFPQCGSAEAEDAAIVEFLDAMADEKKKFWGGIRAVPPEQWPGPTLLVSIPSSDGFTPRTWKVEMEGERYQHEEVLTDPGIRLEGSYGEVFGLLYGFDPSLIGAIMPKLGFDADQFAEAIQNSPALRPIDKLNLNTMPLQDAIDLSVFLATVQIQMDRFLPGQPACGGPIDVMVLRMVPGPAVIAYPGKMLHHPHDRSGRSTL